MEDSERERKLKAGREKLSQYLKKKAVKSKNVELKGNSNKADCQTCVEDDSALQSEASVSTSSPSSEVDNTCKLSNMSTSSEDETLDEEEQKVEVPENAARSSAVVVLQPGDAIGAELGSCSAFDHGLDTETATHDAEDVVSKLNGDIIGLRLKEYTNKLQEYENALSKRDSFISQLTESLRVTIEQRDALQVESTKQADLLAKEIETLKLQIQNATEFLKNQKDKNGISAEDLFKANNEIFALKQLCAEKNDVIETFNQQNSQLNTRLHYLQSELDDAINKHSELEFELKVKDEEIFSVKSVNNELLKSLNEITEQRDNSVKFFQLKEEEASQLQIVQHDFDRVVRESAENEACNLRHQTLLKSDIEQLRVNNNSLEEALKVCEKEHKILINQLQLELETVKTTLEDNAGRSNNEVQNLIQQINDLQLELETSKKALKENKISSMQEIQSLAIENKELQSKLADWPIALSQQLENHKKQTEAMRNEMQMSHQIELENLKEKILTLNLEREHFQIKMTEAENYNAKSDIIEKLQLQLQEKDFIIEQYTEKTQTMESTISKYSTDVDELKIKLDQVISEKQEIQTSLSNADVLVQQLQVQNSELKNLEAVIQRDKELLEICNKEIECKAQAYYDLETNFNSTTKQLNELNLLYENTCSEKLEVENILKAKEGEFELLQREILQLKELETVVTNERRLVQQYAHDLSDLNERYCSLESRFDIQSQQFCELQVCLTQTASEKQEMENELRARENVLEQLKLENANLKTLETVYNNEKQKHEMFEAETILQLKANNDIIDNLRLENSELGNIRNDLENKKLLIESLHKQLTDLDGKRQSLMHDTESQAKHIDELKLYLDQANSDKLKAVTDYSAMKAEFELLIIKESTLVKDETFTRCVDVQVDFDDSENWKAKYDQLLVEKVELEVELQAFQTDTRITPKSDNLCVSDVVANFSVEDSTTQIDTNELDKSENGISRLIKFVDQLTHKVETEKIVNVKTISNELTLLREQMVKVVSIDALRKELENAVSREEMENIHMKNVNPLGMADREDLRQRNEDLLLFLQQETNEKLYAIDNFNKLKADLELLRSRQKSAINNVEVQVEYDDKMEWKEKYDQLLQEKVELEMELQAIQIDTGIAREYLRSPDTDTCESECLDSQSLANEKSLIPNVKFDSFTAKLINIIDRLLNKVENVKDLEVEGVESELRKLRKNLVKMESVDVLQQELACAVEEKEMQNIHIRDYKPLGTDVDSSILNKQIEDLKRSLEQAVNEKHQLMADYSNLKSEFERLLINKEKIENSAETQIDLNDQVNWKEKYDQLLQIKVELEIELQTIKLDTGITSETAHLCDTDVSTRVTSKNVMDSVSEYKDSCRKYKSCIENYIESVDRLLRLTENVENLNLHYIVSELHLLRDHMICLSSIDVLQKELENTVSREEMNNIRVSTVQPLGSDDVNYLEHRIEELTLSLDQSENGKRQAIANYTDEKFEFNLNKLREKAIAVDTEVQVSFDDQMTWKEKYEQVLQEKVELEIEMQTHDGQRMSENKQISAECINSETFVNKLISVVDQLLSKVDNEKDFAVSRELHDLRDNLENIGSVDVLQHELESAVDEQERRNIQIKNYPLLSQIDPKVLTKQIEELEHMLEQTISEKQQVTTDFNELKCELERLTIKQEKIIRSSEMQTDDQVDWKEKYDQLLQEKLELEIELQTIKMDSGIISEEATEICDSIAEPHLASDNSVDKSGEKNARCLIDESESDFFKLHNAKYQSQLDELMVTVDGLLKKIESDTDLDLAFVVNKLKTLREHLRSIFSIDVLQKELARAVDLQEMKNIHVKSVQPLGFTETENLAKCVEELKVALEQMTNEKLQEVVKFNELKIEFDRLKSAALTSSVKPSINDAEVPVDLDNRENWKEKYDQLLQEKVELEIELQTINLDTGIARQSAYLCGTDIDANSSGGPEVSRASSQLFAESKQSDLIKETCVKYESRMQKLLVAFDQMLSRVTSENHCDSDAIVRELRVLREQLVNVASVDVLQRELESAVGQQEMEHIHIKRVQPLGSFDDVDADQYQQSDDLIRCKCNEVVNVKRDKEESTLEFSNQSQVESGDELLKLKQKIGYLEHQLVEKENDLVRIRQELHAQYEEDVEHIRKCLESSLAQEAQVDVEAEVDELKEKVDADIRARNMENVRLCLALQELKVQVQQLQRDKQKLEQSLGDGEIVSLDDVQMDFDDVHNLLSFGSPSKSDKWDVMSENSDDSKLSNGHARRLLAYLLRVYVNIGKTINKELIHLIGTDLGVCDVTMAGDKSIQHPDWMSNDDVGEAESSFQSNAGDDGVSDNVYENLVLETGSKLNISVQRLLGMLSALIQQLQENQRSSSATNDESHALLNESNEDLVAQLSAEARSKDFLGAELNKTSDLLKAAEAEKLNLKEELARKEKLLSEMACQLEETKSQSQKLEECLAEGGLISPLEQELDSHLLGEGGQITRSLPVESQCSHLADDGTGLLDVNARLQREKRGLQHKVERERSELTARIRELEQLLEESSATQDQQMEVKRQEISDLQQQIDALDKQLKGYKHFIEEQTLEREQEREDFQRELSKLQDVVREKDRAQNSEERLSREVETWQEQLKEKNELYKQLFEKKELLEKELEILVEKSNSDQDVIRDLERQLDCKSRSEKILNERMEKLQSELTQTSRVHHDQSLEIEQLRKLSVSSQLSVSTALFEEYFVGGQLDMDNPPSPESIVVELRSQVQHVEEKISRHSLDLEGLLVMTSCLSSPCSEEVSVREQLEVLRVKEKETKSKSEAVEPSFGAFIKDVRRLEDKVESLARSKDIVFKKLKDYEAQLVKQRQAEEELQLDRDMLQQKVNAQLLQITSLQARIEKRRFGFEDDEIAQQMMELQNELGKERQLVDCKTKQIEELQECVSELQQQCGAYKKQISELMQRYNGDMNLHKQAQSAATVELNETKQRSEILKNDLLKTQKQLEDVSSLLQSVMTEKNKEIDMMSTEAQLLEKDNEELKQTVEILETKLSNAMKIQQQLSVAHENVAKLTQDVLEKETKLNETERDLKKCQEIVDQKRREVEALKLVLEEKAQLVEQVATLRAELVDLTQYQARLQEDFDTVQSILEDKQIELSLAQQEIGELNIFKESIIEDKTNLQNEVELMRQRLVVPKVDFEVQVETKLENKVKLDEQNNKILTLHNELHELLSAKEGLSENLKSEEEKVSLLNKKLKAVKNRLENSEENVKQLSAELEKSQNELKQAKDELNQSLQLKSRLEAEIAWRDTKIFRIEDELEQIKSNKSETDGNSRKTSLYKFLEEVRQEVLRESESLNRSERVAESSDLFLKPSKDGAFKKPYERDDGRQSISPGMSASSSDVESVNSEPLPVPVRSLMRKVYKEGIHVLNLSELDAVEEQVPTDAPVQDWNRNLKLKSWENEKLHLVAEIEALKELLTHVTNVAAASRSVDSQLSSIPELLRSILKLLSNDRAIILEHLSGTKKYADIKNDKSEKYLSELMAMYSTLSQTIQNAILNLKRGSSNESDPNSTAWEVQMAVAKERLLNQTEQKKLLNQLQTLEQQLGLRERQLKRQAELLEFRVQQEQMISEDLRRNLDMEKSRCIELCSQLALEKGRAAHMDLNITQLKADLTASQIAVEQEKQELFSTMQQLKNEKSTVESYVQALQTERSNFTQLQEAMEAEKRRNKSACQRDQQIKEELRHALITERDKQLELTSMLEAERIALQNARHELLRAQNRNGHSSQQTEKRISNVVSPNGSLEDISSTLALEKKKAHDLTSALQKEQHKVTMLTATLQQDRKQLLDELDSARETCSRLQSKFEIVEAQKANILKDVQRNREEVHRLELESDKLCNDLAVAQNNLYQKDQEIEQLRRVQKEMNKDWDVERELERQKLQEMKFDVCKLQQKVASLEKEKEVIKISEHLIDGGGLAIGLHPQNKHHALQSLRSETGLSQVQFINLENLRQRIFLLILKVRDSVNKVLQSDKSNTITFNNFSESVKSILSELDGFSQELQVPLLSEGGLEVHLELMEKVVRHNAELAEFALRLSEDKLSLRETLMREKNELDSFKWMQGSSSLHALSSNAGILSAERASWAQERARLQQSLHKAESELIRVSSRQSHVMSPAIMDQVDDAKTIWQKYLKAESFRKNLVFQKTYLLLVLAGYQYTESGTLEVLGRLGCLTNPHSLSGRNEYRHSKAFQRFRSAARLIGAIFRMKYLVRRWRRYDGSFMHAYGTPFYENSNDRFSMTSSISYTPSSHSQPQRFSFNAGYTPPVKDAPKRRSVDERSSVSRNLPFTNASLSSSASSNISVNGRLSDYVRRFDNIQQQLGIVVKDSRTTEK